MYITDEEAIAHIIARRAREKREREQRFCEELEHVTIVMFIGLAFIWAVVWYMGW